MKLCFVPSVRSERLAGAVESRRPRGDVCREAPSTIRRLPLLSFARGAETRRWLSAVCRRSTILPTQRGANGSNRLMLLTAAMKIPTAFCANSWPKSIDLCMHSQTCLNDVAGLLNQRPRKALDFATPAESMAEGLQSLAKTITLDS